MSGAAGQAFRAGTRESAGNGSSNLSNAVTANNDTSSIPNLEPDGKSIKALLQGQRVIDKTAKYNIVKGVFEVRGQLQQSLEDIRVGSSANLQAIIWNAITNGTKMRAAARTRPVS